MKWGTSRLVQCHFLSSLLSALRSQTSDLFLSFSATVSRLFHSEDVTLLKHSEPLWEWSLGNGTAECWHMGHYSVRDPESDSNHESFFHVLTIVSRLLHCFLVYLLFFCLSCLVLQPSELLSEGRKMPKGLTLPNGSSQPCCIDPFDWPLLLLFISLFILF